MNLRAETAEQRFAIYSRLQTRNRFVSILRVALPVAGALVFLVFVAQLLLASLTNNFGIGKISFSGSSVVVDTPSYSGVMANGDVYKVSAGGAQAAVASLNIINLTNASLQLTKPDGTQMSAEAASGSFESLRQIVRVPTTAKVSDSRGNSGTLSNVVADLARQTLKASGPVTVSLSSGMNVQSDSLSYDAKANRWDFGHATVTLPLDATDGSGGSP
jgi:lipopolysaccharide export system protein LptC